MWVFMDAYRAVPVRSFPSLYGMWEPKWPYFYLIWCTSSKAQNRSCKSSSCFCPFPLESCRAWGPCVWTALNEETRSSKGFATLLAEWCSLKIFCSARQRGLLATSPRGPWPWCCTLLRLSPHIPQLAQSYSGDAMILIVVVKMFIELVLIE